MLVLALAAAAFTVRGQRRLPSTPDEAVNRFFEAAERGDAPAYLTTTVGDLRRSFEATQSQLGAAAFAASLRESVAGMKGRAVSQIDASPDRAVLEVDLVFSDHNLRQRFTLVRQGDGWLIAQIDRADTMKPPIPYDAPVFDTGS